MGFYIFFQNSIIVLGRKTLDVIEYSLNILIMIYLSLRATFLDQAQGIRSVFSVISAQIYFTGFQALPIISLIALASGSLVVMQSTFQLSLLGGREMIASVMVALVVREISPLLVALIVIARSGTAVASEIGNMKVNKEVEALEVMGINPLSYIIFPRIIGGIVSTLCLSFYFIMIAIFGGFLMAYCVQNISFSFYYQTIAQAFTFEDTFLFLLKNSFSGAIIFVIACFQGLSVQKSSHEVPQVTTKAVLNSLIYVIVFNFCVTIIFYLNQLIKLGIL